MSEIIQIIIIAIIAIAEYCVTIAEYCITIVNNSLISKTIVNNSLISKKYAYILDTTPLTISSNRHTVYWSSIGDYFKDMEDKALICEIIEHSLITLEECINYKYSQHFRNIMDNIDLERLKYTKEDILIAIIIHFWPHLNNGSTIYIIIKMISKFPFLLLDNNNLSKFMYEVSEMQKDILDELLSIITNLIIILEDNNYFQDDITSKNFENIINEMNKILIWVHDEDKLSLFIKYCIMKYIIHDTLMLYINGDYTNHLFGKECKELKKQFRKTKEKFKFSVPCAPLHAFTAPRI